MYTIRVDTPRMKLMSSNRKMALAMLDYELRNRQYHEPWEDTNEESFYTKAYQRDRVAFEKKTLSSGSAIDLWLVEKNEGIIIGKIVVFGIMFGNASGCMVGYALDKDHVGMGYMHEALLALENFIFNELGLHRIEINIIPRNTRSINVAKRLGYTYEGLSKCFMRVNGKWEDHQRYAKLNPDILINS